MAEHLLLDVFLLFVTSLVTVSANDVVNATAGKIIVLPCEGPEGRVVALQWEKSKINILIYRDGRVEKTQDEQFKDRVELQNPESGKLGLILHNVTEEDSGNYTCEGLVQTSKRQKRAVQGEDFSHSIQLSVRPEETNSAPKPHKAENEEEVTHTDSGGAADQNRSHLTLVTVVIVAVILIVGILYWKRNRIKQRWIVVKPPTLA